MKRIDFNKNWFFKSYDEDGDGVKVELPHDAMLYEKRSKKSRGGHNIGWFMGGKYLYTKTFFIPEDYKQKKIVIEFEAVYKDAKVFINGKEAGFNPYGYTNFYIKADEFLKFGTQNEIKVVADNSDQPNSRWYTGSGIYRPAYLHIGEKEHILLNGVKIKALSINPAVIEVSVKTSTSGTVNIEIADNNKIIAAKYIETDGETIAVFQIEDANLWSVESPHMYTCNVTFGNDVQSQKFGIRKLEWSAEEGFKINGRREILRGACVHHDNGLLGACSYPEAEERKIRILKENGYNAIRSAHNPCSKALLDACDRLGMLVMDEYVDMWYIRKTEYDYVTYFNEWWEKDLTHMVDKDYNHPSVIMYSTGNEVAETAQERGIKLTGEMTEFLHKLDDSRPVTCGVNIFFNFLSSIGFGVYSDEKAKKQVNEIDKKKPVGSEFYNTVAGILGAHTMKIGATFIGCDIKTRDAYVNMDIAGYNYGIYRYKQDLKKYPERLILGTETFCADAYRFWEFAKDNPAIIGDFVWAGMDYLGEAGIGSWEHEEYAPVAADNSGWLTAGSGRIDITGRPIGEAAYTKIAFEGSDKPVIAVRPVYKSGKRSPSAWKMSDAIQSWTWTGCEGCKATVEVYARAYKVELYINGSLIGTKKPKNDCKVVFNTKYEAGEISAVTYDEKGKKLSNVSLITAGDETQLRIEPEKNSANFGELCFVRLKYTDEQGILKPKERHNIKVEAEGGKLIAFGNACPYNPRGYLSEEAETYYGEALAIVRVGEGEKVIITASDGTRKAQAAILCNPAESISEWL